MEQWQSLIYQYIVGGLFFFFVIFVALKTGSTSLKSKEGRNTILTLVAGFVFFLVVHSTWIYLASK